MSIYDVIEKGEASQDKSERIVAAIHRTERG